MIRIIMHGCNGSMGKMISNLASDEPQVKIVAGIDTWNDGHNSYPVYADIADCNMEADCLVDFYTADAVGPMLNYCMERGLPCVLCTTGLNQEQLQRVEEASRKIAILKSANMSLGINLLFKLLKDAAAVLAPAGFDMEILEKHHNRKIDAPSGTALALADTINQEFNNEYQYVYERNHKRERRGNKEIGISAVRGGTIVGEHDVIFAGQDEIITFSHGAYSKAVFGKGAIQAAKFLAGKPAGLYNMSHVING